MGPLSERALKLGLPELDSAEGLGRTIVSRKVANRARRTELVDYSVFLEKPDALSVSVDRMDHAPVAVMAELAQQRAGSRTPPRRFRGWAVLAVRNAATVGRTVAATPHEGNPYHADIFLNLPLQPDRYLQKAHAADLARRCAWRAAP